MRRWRANPVPERRDHARLTHLSDGERARTATTCMRSLSTLARGLRMSPQAPRAAAPAAPTSFDLSSAFADAVDRAASYVVAIHARRRIPSSGIVWRDGVIVSANHTVNRDDDITITLPSGESPEATASVVGRDAASDLVVLR